MLTQSEEEWMERDELSGSEYQRRRQRRRRRRRRRIITHEDFCNRYSSQQFHAQLSPTDWRQSTMDDHCCDGRSNSDDRTTTPPLHASHRRWFRNDDLRGCGRQQRRRHSCKQCCNCRNTRNELVAKSCDALNATTNTVELMESGKMFENAGTVISTSLANVHSAIANDSQSSNNSQSARRNVASWKATTNTPHYGPFQAHKIKITAAVLAANRARSARAVDVLAIANGSGSARAIDERRLTREIELANDGSKIANHLSLINEEMHDEKSDDKSSDRCFDISEKQLSIIEFDKIPLFASKILKKTPNQLDCSNSSTPTLSAKLAKRTDVNDPRKAVGRRDPLMDELELELLKYHQKEARNGKTTLQTIITNWNSNEMKKYSMFVKKNSIQKFTNYWHKRMLKNYTEKLRERDAQQGDRMEAATLPTTITVGNASFTADAIDGNELKSIVEIRETCENLRELSNNSKFTTGNRNALSRSDDRAAAKHAEFETGRNLLRSHAPVISSAYSTKSPPNNYDRIGVKFESAPTSRTFYVTGKTESKPPHSTTLPTTTVTPETVNHKSSICSRGECGDAITARIFIRNSEMAKAPVINVISASARETSRPRWMVLKVYRSSSSGTVGEKIPGKELFDQTLTRSHSYTSGEIRQLDELIKCENFDDTTAATVIGPEEVQQEIFERNETKMSNSSDLALRLRAQTDQSAAAIAQMDSLINSRIITEHEISSIDDALRNNTQYLTVIKTYEIYKIHHTATFERSLTVGELANQEFRISAVRYSNSSMMLATNWHATYKILTENIALFETYYPNEEELDEYVLNELGAIGKLRGKDAWLLGQFSTACISTVLHLLKLCVESNLLKVNELGLPCAIVRAIGAAISKFMLEVKWDDFQKCNGKNDEKILPSAWTGSKEIMVAFLRRMGERIGYGQSWCYAGLLTSICRCVGIPCRMITVRNFAQRIENDAMIKLDIIDGIIAESSKDAIWNYHIWNELWFRSEMLENGSGWHVCDATPIAKEEDELLDGRRIFPVRRIRTGEVFATHRNADESFGHKLQAMLNATIICNCYYRQPMTRTPIFAHSKKFDKKIPTKLITSTVDDDIDVTMNYNKQSANLNSSLVGSNCHQIPCMPTLLHSTDAGNIQLQLSDFQNISIDRSINGWVTITNNSLFEETINAQIQVDLVSYTGTVITHVYFLEKMLTAQSKQ
ncbi:unnamed protein product, partial [Litomosoides sigmodontis]